MRWLYQMTRVFLILSAIMPCGRGEALPEALARPPESGVLDTGGLFQRDAAALERVRSKIRKLHQEHGYRMYVVVEPVFMSGTPAELAARLQDAWLPDGNGIVIAFESDSRTLGFGRDVGEKPESALSEALVPTHEASALLREVLAHTDNKLAPAPYLEMLVGNLVSGFNDYFQRRAAPPPPGRSLRFALLTIGGLALLALGAIMVGAVSRMQSVAGSQTLRFPSVDQPERLGAPSGASAVSRSFKQRD
jgi:hypothetical protein